MGNNKSEGWFTLNEALIFLLSKGFEERDIVRKFSDAIQNCFIRCYGTIIAGGTEKDVLVQSLDYAYCQNVDWEGNKVTIYLKELGDLEELLIAQKTYTGLVVSNVRIPMQDLYLWARQETFRPDKKYWPASRSIDLWQVLNELDRSLGRSLFKDYEEADTEERRYEFSRYVLKLFREIEDLARSEKISVFGRQKCAGELVRLDSKLFVKNFIKTYAKKQPQATIYNKEWFDLTFDGAEILAHRDIGRGGVLEFSSEEQLNQKKFAEEGIRNLPVHRPISTKEAVYSMCFHDASGGELLRQFRSISCHPRLSELLMRGAKILKDAASVGKITVLGKEHLSGEQGIFVTIPAIDWLGLEIDDRVIKSEEFSYLAGARVVVRGRQNVATVYTEMIFNSEELANLHRELFETNKIEKNNNNRVLDAKPEEERRGRPSKYNWDEFNGELMAYLYQYGPTSTQAELVEYMSQWCLDTWDEEPSQSMIKGKVKPLYTRVRNLEGEK